MIIFYESERWDGTCDVLANKGSSFRGVAFSEGKWSWAMRYQVLAKSLMWVLFFYSMSGWIVRLCRGF
jgi:hypothetical protein